MYAPSAKGWGQEVLVHNPTNLIVLKRIFDDKLGRNRRGSRFTTYR